MHRLNLFLGCLVLAAPAAMAKSSIGSDERVPTTATGVQTGQQPVQEGGRHHRHGKFGQALTQLPKEKAEMVRATMDQARAQNRPIAQKLRALEESRDALLASPAFDKPAFVETQKQIRTLRAQMMANTDDAIATYEEKLTAAERQDVAKAMHPGRGDMPHGAPPPGDDTPR